MFFNFRAFLAGWVFAGTLILFSRQEDYYFYVLLFLFLFNLLLIWPLAGRLRFLAIPFFLSIGSLNLLYLIDGWEKRILFTALATFIYYLSLLGANRLKKYDCDQTAQSMINLATIVTVFFWFSSNYGWYLNFNIDSWILVVTTIASTFFIIFPSLTICFISCYKVHYRQSQKKQIKTDKLAFLLAFKKQLQVQRLALFFSFLIAFVIGEIIWGLSFWPFGYLTTGMTAVIILFVFWSIVRRFIQRKLTKRFVIVNIISMLILIILLIGTSPWQIIE